MKKSVRVFWITYFSLLALFAILLALVLLGAFGTLPSLKQLENPTLMQASEIYSADGTLMGRLYREHGDRSVVRYKDISPYVTEGLVATEDTRFYEHSGIDFGRTLKAIVSFGKSGGGSTITQQLAKNLLEQGSRNRARRLVEKLKEYIVSIRLESNFTKPEILALYLNVVPFGENVYGIRNASITFFGKEPSQLQPQEAATLVGMLNGNSIYNPRLHPDRALLRRNLVLNRMEKQGYLSATQADQLKATPIQLHYSRPDENAGYAPYFQEVLKDRVKESLAGLQKTNGEPYNLYTDGLRIYTTIDTRMQRYAEEAVAQQMPLLQRILNRQGDIKTGSVWYGRENVLQAAMRNSDRWDDLKAEGLSDDQVRASFYQKVPMHVFAWNDKRWKDTIMTPFDSIKYHRQMMQTAFMVMDPYTGEVRAWVGGIGFKTYKLDHAGLRTKRQVGSSIKPLLYAQAMEQDGFAPESIVVDEQQDFGNHQLVPATSRSCTGRSITMAAALAYSKNCAAAYIMKRVGPPQFSDFIQRIGIPTSVAPHPSITLGSCDLSLFEMMWAYTMFPGHGYATQPLLITRIEDRNGKILKRFDYAISRRSMLTDTTAYKMCRMMQGPVTYGTAKGLMQALGAKELAGKTGTTNDNADAWFMGFSPQLLAGVWVGCDDRFIRIESVAGQGGSAARPIWQAFFKKVYANPSLSIDRQATFARPLSETEDLSDSTLRLLITNDPLPVFDSASTKPFTLDTTHNSIPAESQLPAETSQPRAIPQQRNRHGSDSVHHN